MIILFMVIDLMHNDVKQNNAFTVRTCIVGVLVTNRNPMWINMASYFLEAGNLNGSNDDMCSDVAEPSNSSSRDLFDFECGSRSRTFNSFTLFPLLLALLAAIFDLKVTTTPILPFGACYVIMHKVYYQYCQSFLASETVGKHQPLGELYSDCIILFEKDVVPCCHDRWTKANKQTKISCRESNP